MYRRSVCFAVELRIIRLIFLEHIVNGSQKHSCDSDNRFLVAPAFFQGEVTAADFWELLSPNGTQSTLNEKGLDIGSGPADPGSLFLSGALVVLRRKPSPGAKMR